MTLRESPGCVPDIDATLVRELGPERCNQTM
jgi:hypothetical protein